MSDRKPIHILAPALKNQIAAGEVVERPASVVKELVENSLDAGATRVEVAINHGGRGRILVADNGHGIDSKELELAVTRHATSKLTNIEGLAAIHSFGFRGEALPSIGSVSRLTMTSVVDGKDAWFIRIEAGELVEQGPAALASGTRVEVEDLFVSVPARLKFLKTETTESRRCQDVIMRMALANPATAFTFSTNNRQLFALPQNQSLSERLAAFWPPAICEKLIPVERTQGDYRLTGLAGSPSTAQARGDRILLFVNGRPVQDKLLLGGVRQGYSGRLLSKEHPQAVLFLTLPPELVDVNVHPAKQEVRFADESAVFTTMRQGLFQALSTVEGLPASSPAQTMGISEPKFPSGQGAMLSQPNHRPGNLPDKFSSYQEYAAGPREACLPLTPGQKGTAKTVGGLDYLGQIANTYLLLRQGDSLLLIDQHAAHERILLAAMRGERTKGDSQPLALPVEMSLHPSEATRLQELWGELRKAGFLLETASPNLVRMKGIPPTLDAGQAKEYLRAAVSSQAKTMDDLWAMLSCKAAIKAGQPLADDEALSLIETWLETPERDYCPHGRPVVISWSPAKLEKLFKRK